MLWVHLWVFICWDKNTGGAHLPLFCCCCLQSMLVANMPAYTQMYAHCIRSCLLIIFSPIPALLLCADEWGTVVALCHFTGFSNVGIMVKLRTSEIGSIVPPPSLISQPQYLRRQRGSEISPGVGEVLFCLFFLVRLFSLRLNPFMVCASFTTSLTTLRQRFPWPWLRDYAAEHYKLSCHQNLHLGKYNHFLVRTQAGYTETKSLLHNNESNVLLGKKKTLCHMGNYHKGYLEPECH